MKNVKRILTVLICVLMVMSSISITAFADAETGSITIKDPIDSEATVAGKTFNVYKVFNATTNGANTSYSWIVDSEENIVFYDFFFGTPENDAEEAYIGVTGKTSGSVQDAVEYIAGFENDAMTLSQFAENIYKYISAKGIQPTVSNQAGVTAESITFSNLDYGYYMIYDATILNGSAVRSAVMLTNVNKNAEITLKANRPQIDKKVLNNEGKYAEGTSSTIGDVVTFKIETVVPDYSLYSSYVYKVEDTMPTGLTLNAETIKVYKNTIEDSAIVEPEVNVDGEKFEIAFTLKNNFITGDKIIILYDVVVNNDATKEISNTAYLIYSNDPTNDGESGTTGMVSNGANIYCYQMLLTKFAQDSSGNFLNRRLAGAEFELYEKGSTEPIKFSVQKTQHESEVDNEYDKYVVDPNGDITILKVHEEGEETIQLQHLNYGGHRGDVLIFGLAEGEYELKEVKAPDGFIKPEESFFITITDTIGELGSVGTLNVTGSHTGTGAIVNTNGMGESILTVWAEITNKPGTALPETGGMGTTLFTVLGIVLMSGSVAYLVLKKKKTAAH